MKHGDVSKVRQQRLLIFIFEQILTQQKFSSFFICFFLELLGKAYMSTDFILKVFNYKKNLNQLKREFKNLFFWNYFKFIKIWNDSIEPFNPTFPIMNILHCHSQSHKTNTGTLLSLKLWTSLEFCQYFCSMSSLLYKGQNQATRLSLISLHSSKWWQFLKFLPVFHDLIVLKSTSQLFIIFQLKFKENFLPWFDWRL